MSLIKITNAKQNETLDEKSPLLDKLLDDLHILAEDPNLVNRSYDLAKYFSPLNEKPEAKPLWTDEETEEVWKPICDEETFRRELETHPSYRQKIIRVVKSNILQAATEGRWAAHLNELAISNLETFV